MDNQENIKAANDIYSNILVSIIIPVYNVEKYIDRCMESVTNQTHTYIEIILINDGSTDNSLHKCEFWERKDKRIKLISKKNEGLGITRNLGVDLANADYLMFVDSDDWVADTIVEKLLKSLIDADADMSFCDRYEIKETMDTCNIIASGLHEKVIQPHIYKNAIFEITPSQWAKLYKRDLIKANNIKQPEHYYEDAVTPVMIALCKKVSYVSEPLYYYVIDRMGSITNDISSINHLVRYLDTVVNLFIKYSLFSTYKKEVYELCRRRINWNLYQAERLLQSTYDKVWNDNIGFIKKYWSNEEIEKENLFNLNKKDWFMVWGSYNLMTSMKMLLQLNNPDFLQMHYCCSSIISALNEDNGYLNQYKINHPNAFRKYHILREFKRDFIHSNVGEFSSIKYLVIDFLEERYNVGFVNNSYFTISDAFLDLGINIEGASEIKRFDENLMDVWQSSCMKFIDYIKCFFPNARIVLVKSKLTTVYGTLTEKWSFSNQQEINRINRILDIYYDFFEKNCTCDVIIDPIESDFYYTDMYFRHGCHPWHLNYYAYREISERIIDKIWKNKR